LVLVLARLTLLRILVEAPPLEPHALIRRGRQAAMRDHPILAH
jgi:hypothetical protein